MKFEQKNHGITLTLFGQLEVHYFNPQEYQVGTDEVYLWAMGIAHELKP